MVAGLSKSPIEMYRALPPQTEFDMIDAIQAVKYAGIAWLDCYRGHNDRYTEFIQDFVELIRHPEVSFDERLDQYLDGSLDLVEISERRHRLSREQAARAGGAVCDEVVLRQDTVSSMLLEESVPAIARNRSFG